MVHRVVKGLALLEVLLALAITSFALLTMIGVYVSGLQLLSRARGITTGTGIARQVLEMVKEEGFALVPEEEATYDGRVPDPVHPVLGFPPEPYPATSVDGKPYPIVVRVKPIREDLRSVTVEVYYLSSSKVTLQTLVKP